MKLIFCNECHTVVPLRREIQFCGCGWSSGQYLNEFKATYSGQCVPFEIRERSFVKALLNRPQAFHAETVADSPEFKRVGMEIIPMNADDLTASIDLANSVFWLEAKKKYPEIAFSASIGIEPHSSYVTEKGTDDLHYWIAKEDGKVLGTVGLYHELETPDRIWIGWFCVSPDARGKGIGRKLLQFTVNRAKSDKEYKEIWLYTSRDPNEAAAQILYDKMGFQIMTEEAKEPYAILNRRLIL